MSDEKIDRAAAVKIADGDSHVGFDCARAVKTAAANHGFIDKRAIALIDPELIGLFVVGLEDVR